MGDVVPGDGQPLPPVGRHHIWWRSLFTASHAGHRYAVDVNYFDAESRAELYRDGERHAVAEMPAAFPVPGGTIQVAATMLGMKRAHLVLDSGEEHVLTPEPGTGEHWRAEVATRHPMLSRWVGRAAILVLVVALVVAALEGLEFVTGIGPVADLVGTFTSPIELPAWGGTALGALGILAGLERALTLRYHWLLDSEHDE